jgi:hypothetical protein
MVVFNAGSDETVRRFVLVKVLKYLVRLETLLPTLCNGLVVKGSHAMRMDVCRVVESLIHRLLHSEEKVESAVLLVLSPRGRVRDVERIDSVLEVGGEVVVLGFGEHLTDLLFLIETLLLLLTLVLEEILQVMTHVPLETREIHCSTPSAH